MSIIITPKFNNLAIYDDIEHYLSQLNVILRRPNHELAFRQWCATSIRGIRNSIINNISCGYAVSMYPYNYDSELDDLYGCNDPFHDDTRTLKDNYTRTYKLVARLALENAHRFRAWDTSSVADRVYDKDYPATNRLSAIRLGFGHNH